MAAKKKKVRTVIDGFYPAAIITADQARKIAKKAVDEEEKERKASSDEAEREARRQLPILLEIAFERIREQAEQGATETYVDFGYENRTLHQITVVAQELRKLGFVADVDPAGHHDQYRLCVKWGGVV